MNLYSRKQQWKAGLLVFATIIVGLSLWYSNYIVNKIREEERQKVQLWSEAVKKRLTLINYTESLFKDMRREERNKINIWSQATGRVTTASDNELRFLQDILSKNVTIPVLVVDKKGKIQFDRNVDARYLRVPASRDSLVKAFGEMYDPITLSIQGIEQRVYYKDSHIITELEKNAWRSNKLVY